MTATLPEVLLVDEPCPDEDCGQVTDQEVTAVQPAKHPGMVDVTLICSRCENPWVALWTDADAKDVLA